MPTFSTAAHHFGSGGRSLGPPSRITSSFPAVERLPFEHLTTQDRRPPVVDVSDQTSSKPADAAPARTPSAAPTNDTVAERPSCKTASAAAPSLATPGGRDYRDSFRVAKTGSSVAKRDDSNPPRFRAAVEAERWRAKLSGDSKDAKAKDDKLDSYRQPAQAEWARERLFGAERKGDEEREEEALEVRKQRVVALTWKPSAAHLVDVAAIDRLEETLRRRLGELESTRGLAGNAARQYFADCDPQRQGRVLLSYFVDVMGRKLNYDFPARGNQASSREVLAALFRRYDVERSGVMQADDFHAALTGASRPGRASGRVVNAIGRLREGFVRNAGGFDALRAADARWFRSSRALELPTGCLTAGAFVDELMELARIAQVLSLIHI